MPYIDRDAFSKQLEHEKELMERGNTFNTALISHTIGIVQEKVKRFPTANVEPVVHAHWVRTRLCNECSRCRGGWLGLPETKRCPDCGARMDEEEKQ